MAKFIVDVPDVVTCVTIAKALYNYLGVYVSVYPHHSDTGTRDSQAPDRRQSTRRLHDKAKARWAKK